MRKALFLLLLFLLPLGWCLFGDSEIIRFLLWVYAPIGAVLSFYIWARPLEEMMFYVTITPFILLVTIWGIVIFSILFERPWFANSTIGAVWGMFASVICLGLGFFHVLLSYGIFHQFRAAGWFEEQQS